MPILVRWKGFAPLFALGFGEDIPSGVYTPWRQWCRFPHYFFDDPQWRHLTEQYAKVTMLIVTANALDDHWALPCSRDASCTATVKRRLAE